MAENKVTEGEEFSKAIWHYVGVAVLWISLLFAGIALERLGLTSDYLTSVVPSEVGGLKKQNTEFQDNQRNVHIGYQMKIAHLSNASDGFLRSICVASSLFRYEPTFLVQ